MRFVGHVLLAVAQAPGAWPHGTRVQKTASAPGDTHQDGARGTVSGSIRLITGELAYWVYWDDRRPESPAFITERRLKRS